MYLLPVIWKKNKGVGEMETKISVHQWRIREIRDKSPLAPVIPVAGGLTFSPIHNGNAGTKVVCKIDSQYTKEFSFRGGPSSPIYTY